MLQEVHGAGHAVLTAKHGCGFLLWPTNVTLPGGDLHIEWSEKDNRIYMTGPAQRVYSGSYTL